MFVNEIALLIVATATITCFLCILLVYLICRKVMEINHRKKVEKIKKEIQPALFTFLLKGGQSPEIQTNSRDEKQAMEEILNKVSEVMEEESMNERLTKLAERHLKKLYQQRLYSRNWSVRMNTLYYIEEFRMESLLPEVIDIFEQKKVSKQEKTQSLRILAVMQDPKIDVYLHTADFLSDSEYRSILLRLGQKQFDRVVVGFNQSKQQLRYALLDVISIKNELQYVSLVEQIFDTSVGEQKIRAFKTLVSLGYVENPRKFIVYAKSSVWEERMLTAKFFGLTKNVQFLPELLRLIHDPVWWVRYQAGQAIAMMPDGDQTLKELLKSEDPFAKDMAWEWLNKGVIQS